jgi:hypothetical protein
MVVMLCVLIDSAYPAPPTPGIGGMPCSGSPAKLAIVLGVPVLSDTDNPVREASLYLSSSSRNNVAPTLSLSLFAAAPKETVRMSLPPLPELWEINTPFVNIGPLILGRPPAWEEW